MGLKELITADTNFVREAWHLLGLFDNGGTQFPADSRDWARGVILGLAVGNLLGLPLEGQSRNTLMRQFPDGIPEINPEEKHHPMDDDLAQAVDLGESLLEKDGRGLNEDWVEEFTSRLVKWRRENGRGIGITTSAVIDLLEKNTPPPEAGRQVFETNGRIAPNGGVMRCAPVALLWHSNPIRLIEDSAASCMVTHYSPLCQWSCLIINVTIALLRVGAIPTPSQLARELRADGAPAEVAEWVGDVGEEIDSLRWNHRHKGHTLLCMQYGLWAAQTPLDFDEALVAVVGSGGDTDTNGAVAGAVLGARYGAKAIPQRWLDCIPERDRLERLADRLAGAAP